MDLIELLKQEDEIPDFTGDPEAHSLVELIEATGKKKHTLQPKLAEQVKNGIVILGKKKVRCTWARAWKLKHPTDQPATQ